MCGFLGRMEWKQHVLKTEKKASVWALEMQKFSENQPPWWKLLSSFVAHCPAFHPRFGNSDNYWRLFFIYVLNIILIVIVKFLTVFWWSSLEGNWVQRTSTGKTDRWVVNMLPTCVKFGQSWFGVAWAKWARIMVVCGWVALCFRLLVRASSSSSSSSLFA